MAMPPPPSLMGSESPSSAVGRNNISPFSEATILPDTPCPPLPLRADAIFRGGRSGLRPGTDDIRPPPTSSRWAWKLGNLPDVTTGVLPS
eukprot:CAMPEP_0182510452 /NCGR_PEP_ID=MMETSP1321-20130603/28697_1 /TAXON_ID=91990 /ORGANISM="Bolidomonas sp., Strain RCC1657" /LENGTH=89 /DNA_ID=CAMNT_0024716913 /DNA_START=598 /DNA_END=867 /DNA_ORIENTATION=+